MKNTHGFTLVEMAIVLAIMVLIIGSGLTLFSAQQEQRRIEDTNAMLSDAREALIGYALANGRLPCPASSISNGQESFCTGDLAAACGSPIVPPAVIPAHGRCTNPYNGFLPAAALGLSPTDTQGYTVDAWKTAQNRIRYAVYEGNITGGTTNFSTFTASGEMKIATMPNITATNPLLSVCASAPSSSTTCGTAISLTSQTPAVIYSLGKNAPTGGTETDEAANLNNDQVFVSHSPVAMNEAGGYFDDQVIWISQYTLFNRMVQAGKLP